MKTEGLLGIVTTGFLLVAGFLFASGWVIMGVILLPQIASTTTKSSIVWLTALGILGGSIFIIYTTLASTVLPELKSGEFR